MVWSRRGGSNDLTCHWLIFYDLSSQWWKNGQNKGKYQGKKITIRKSKSMSLFELKRYYDLFVKK